MVRVGARVRRDEQGEVGASTLAPSSWKPPQLVGWGRGAVMPGMIVEAITCSGLGLGRGLGRGLGLGRGRGVRLDAMTVSRRAARVGKSDTTRLRGQRLRRAWGEGRGQG